jgi:hypothetical protein
VTAPNASGSSATSLFRFTPIERPVEFRTGPAFIEKISSLTSGWPISPWNNAEQKPVISITRGDDHYAIAANWLQEPLIYADEADAACAFFVQLLTAHSQSRPDLLLLHAGAVAIAGRLIVFPASGNIGKSTLAAVLSAKGCVVFSDDALPVSLARGTGSALGIGPRPRLPLPESLSPATRTFIENHIGLRNQNFAYLALPNTAGGLAPRGTELAIGAFVIPDRAANATDEPHLMPASGAETMAQLIGQHLGKRPPARQMVEKLATLIGRIPCWRLSYRNVEQAADFLLAHPSFAAQ